MDRKELRKKLMRKTQDDIKEKLAGKEIHIIKAVKVLADLESIVNLMKEGIDDWKKRSPEKEAQKQLENYKTQYASIEKEKEELAEFIDKNMKEELPNFSEIAGTLLGAKLLAEAGSKRKLAFMPSSTMQVLGAEKALFNHLKKKTSCPKHGVIFNHPLIQKIPKNKRGKAARILAGKLSLAAKIDYFGKEKTDLKKEDETNFAEETKNRIGKL
jgi:RNA processing factor Prp31